MWEHSQSEVQVTKVLACGEAYGELLSDKFEAYHWGQKYDLPNFESRQLILGTCMCFMRTKQTFLGELILNCPLKNTLPKSVAT